jgi:NUMOD3 motif
LPFPKGRKLSKEHIEKLRLAHLGNKYTLGRHHTEETKEKIRQSRLGKKASPETVVRMSLAQLKRYRNRKK